MEIVILANENKCINFPDDSKIFGDPNVWIKDTESTCDVTFRKALINNNETPK